MLVRVLYDPAKGMNAPYVVPLPSWAMIGFDPVEKSAVVDIPNEDFPPQLLDTPPLRSTETHLGRVYHGLDADSHEIWHRHLDERYQEHVGEFRPTLV